MSQEYEGWDVVARPAVKAAILFWAALLILVVGAGLLYVHLYAAQTRADPRPFPAPMLETNQLAPRDHRATPPSPPPPGIDRAMADTAAQGDMVWNG